MSKLNNIIHLHTELIGADTESHVKAIMDGDYSLKQKLEKLFFETLFEVQGSYEGDLVLVGDVPNPSQDKPIMVRIGEKEATVIKDSNEDTEEIFITTKEYEEDGEGKYIGNEYKLETTLANFTTKGEFLYNWNLSNLFQNSIIRELFVCMELFKEVYAYERSFAGE